MMGLGVIPKDLYYHVKTVSKKKKKSGVLVSCCACVSSTDVYLPTYIHETHSVWSKVMKTWNPYLVNMVMIKGSSLIVC